MSRRAESGSFNGHIIAAVYVDWPLQRFEKVHFFKFIFLTRIVTVYSSFGKMKHSGFLDGMVDFYGSLISVHFILYNTSADKMSNLSGELHHKLVYKQGEIHIEKKS